MELGFLDRCLAVGVNFSHTLILGISEQKNIRRQAKASFFEKLKIMFSVGAKKWRKGYFL
jgi:uncharacterized membrane protein